QLDTVLRKSPEDLDALLQRSDLLIQEGKISDAQLALTKVLRLRPDSAQAYHLSAKAMLARRQFETYHHQLDEAVARDSYLFPARVDLALELALGGADSAAVAQIESLPAAQRTLPDFHIYGAWTALVAGDLIKAGGHVQALVQTRSDSSEAALVAALYAVAKHRPVAAREAAA